MFIKLLTVSLVFVFLSFLLLGFNIFFRKRKFPETSVGHNKNMKKLGITCARCDELKKYHDNRNKIKINPKELKITLQ